jgi:hypothetical protein
MESFLITVDGSEHEVSTGTVRRLLDTSARFWLDLAGVDKSTADGLLRDTFGFHPLAVQDAEHFGQRPKIDAYDDVTLMVVYGASGSDRLVEMHCLYTENYLVTVHRDECPELTALATRLKERAEPRPDHVMLLYLRHRPASRRHGRPPRRVPPPRLAVSRRHRPASQACGPATRDTAGAVARGAAAEGTRTALGRV